MSKTRARIDVTRLVRADLLAMAGYEPIEPTDVLARRLGIPPEKVVKLDGNENPYGPSPKALAALGDYRGYHLYPDPLQRRAREALARHLALGEEHIVLGSGSDELIDLLLRAVLSSGDAVINCQPTFGMYPFSTELCGGRVVDVPRREDFSLDVSGIGKAAVQGAKLAFVCSPNNPTGNVLSRAELDALLATGLLVVLDEAYVEFSGDDGFAPLVTERDNLVVLRTFSKWAGLAGLRVGYGVFPTPLASLLMKVKPPYNLNLAAEAAVLASLDDAGTLMERVKALVQERQRLFEALETSALLRPLPSRGNFLLCRVAGVEARRLADRLAQRGIFVRYYDTALLQEYLRISVGLSQHTDALAKALEEIHREVEE
jgi:histidinol-phosphate aminotransferase